MAHEIWDERFVAVRKPAWHRIGRVFEENISPAAAAEEAGLLYAVGKFPLYTELGGEYQKTGQSIVGRVEDGQIVSYGIAQEFEITMLVDVMPMLKQVADKYPLSCAGALRKGAEVFFTFGVSESVEIAGEEYKEFLTVLHSYRPGVAHKIMYTPVRVVCANTLITGEESATSRLYVSHVSGSRERLNAAYAISQAIAQSRSVKTQLEKLAGTPVTLEMAESVMKTTYARYMPKTRIDPLAMDLVGADVVEAYSPTNEHQANYHNRVLALGLEAFARFNDEHRLLANTAYGIYQAVVEVADFRGGRTGEKTGESAVNGIRATEKQVAWRECLRLTR